MKISANARRTLRYSLAATLLLSCAPAALHAETWDKDEKIRRLEKMMIEMQSQIKSLKNAVGEERVEGRKTREKVRAVAERSPAYAPPPPGMAIPVGAVPAFVTADKKLQFGALTITPGGFAAMESVYRTRTEQADIGSAYNQIPLGGPQAGTGEYRLTPHQSRIAALIEAPITPTVLASGYGEFDFLATGASTNANESNSFVPRIRHLYGTLDFGDYGFHVLGGQNWSLATLNSKGITPRNEVTPPTIDAQYVPGFVWKRQAQIRITKDFNQRLWMALSAEEAQTTINNCANAGANTYGAITTPTNTNGVFCNALGQNNLSTGTTAYSLNHVPDVVGKIAYEAALGDRDVHLEGFGLYRDLYDQVGFTNGTSSNRNTTGYGIGGGLIVPVLPKRLDFQASGIYGRGIGSYGSGQNSDSTVLQTGALSPIKEAMALAGFTLHATPSIDLYAFGGFERSFADYYGNGAAVTTQATGYSGFGVPNANDSGCGNVGSTATESLNTFVSSTGGSNCASNTKLLWQLTGGFWDKVYKGSFGEVRVGVQYSYTKRELFSSDYQYTPTGAAAPTALGRNFSTNDQAVLTSLRYYPFQ